MSKSKDEMPYELRRCPFCGGKPIMHDTQDGKFVIECDYCHVKSYALKEKAVVCMMWNSRKIPDDLIADRWEEAEKFLLQAVKNAGFAVTRDKKRL